MEAWPPGNTRTEREKERGEGEDEGDIREHNVAKVCAERSGELLTRNYEQPRDLINESSSEFLIALSIPRLLGRIRDVTLSSFD